MEACSMEQGINTELPSPVKASKKEKKVSNKKASKVAQPAQAKAAPKQPSYVPEQEELEQGSHRGTLHKHLRKTRFCMYHLQGACQFGTECSFAHSLAEMHQTPDLSKTQLCKAWADGNCSVENCVFAHGDDELRSTDMFYKKTLCIWNEKGKCRNGEKCRFAHGLTELRANQGSNQGSKEKLISDHGLGRQIS